MKMKYWLFAAFVNCLSLNAVGQLKWEAPKVIEQVMTTTKSSYNYKINRLRPTSPRLTTVTTPGNKLGGTYWTNNITTQSYRQEKWGTYYYWDVQGNLREMKGFIDIAGKNKRGLKLVFPWR